MSYVAYPNERPIINSDVLIHGWKRLSVDPPNLPAAARGHIWEAEIPADIHRIFTLYEGETQLNRARGPGFAPVSSPDLKPAADTFKFPPNAIQNFPDLTEGEILVIPTADYERSILPLVSVDDATQIATTKTKASRPIGGVKFVPISLWVENVLGVLDEPGEWVVNHSQRKIYYWPASEQPRDVVACKLTELVKVEGQIDYDGPVDKPVKGLVFDGLTFEHAERLPWEGYTGWGLQHHWEIFDRPSAAERFRGTEDCVIQNCRLVSTSGTGIRLDLYCQKNRVTGNEIGHTGAVGVMLGGYGPGTKDVNKQNVVSNNWIHHTGGIYWATPAIMFWQSGENQVSHNRVEHIPYSGITVITRAVWSRERPEADRTVRWSEIGDGNIATWKSREPYMHARGNRVEFNEIQHVMEVMGDGNGIYISGTGGQNQIRYNHIHNCDSDGMADGIRCDDDQDETIIEGNVIHRIRVIGQGICSKGVNHIVNNLIADLLPSRRPIRPERVCRGYIGLQVNPITGSRVERNLVVARHNTYPAMIQDRRYGRGLEPKLSECLASNNLYFCFEDPVWGRSHVEREQKLGVEYGSVSRDPLFLDFANGDLNLKPESPAWKLGYQPLDLSTVGLQSEHRYFGR